MILFVKKPRVIFCPNLTNPHATPTITTTNSLVGDGVGAPAVTLLSDGELDTLTLGQRDPRLLSADDENVALTGGEGVVDGVLEVDNVEAAVVALTVGDDTDTTHVATAGDHGHGASVELDEVGDLASGKIDLDGVVDLDQGNSRPGIMRNQEWDSAAAQLDTLDLAELVLGLLGLDAVDGEAALGVVDETEVLAGLLDRDDVHEAGGLRAYLRRLRRKTTSGRHSRCLCGPGDGLGA
ncbi:hypothetical protein RB594_005060 [Gaeumannomyces avenae]